MTTVFICPVLIHRGAKNRGADDQVVPSGKWRIPILVQNRIEEGEATKGYHQPVGKNHFRSSARQNANNRKDYDSKTKQKVFPKEAERPVINSKNNQGRCHKPESKEKIQPT